MELPAALDQLRASAPELRARYGSSARACSARRRSGRPTICPTLMSPSPFKGADRADVMRLCGVSGLLSGVFGRDVDVVALSARDLRLDQAVRREAAVAS